MIRGLQLRPKLRRFDLKLHSRRASTLGRKRLPQVGWPLLRSHVENPTRRTFRSIWSPNRISIRDSQTHPTVENGTILDPPGQSKTLRQSSPAEGQISGSSMREPKNRRTGGTDHLVRFPRVGSRDRSWGTISRSNLGELDGPILNGT